jgi:chorismate dehydratase
MLRVGKVRYLNTVPLFYRLEGYQVVEGHPHELVKKIREGEIDAGIVSSVEYFFNPDKYFVLRDISISSVGKVCSVLLLSNKPLEEVHKVRITPNSLTSRYLLIYLLKEVYGREPAEVLEGEDAFLAIGDEALNLKGRYDFCYDLGEEWFRATGLPFVYALFLLRKEASYEHSERLIEDLKRSVELFFRDLERGRAKVPEGFVKEYLSSCIDYGLSEAHLESLRMFFEFMERETGKSAPRIISLFPP